VVADIAGHRPALQPDVETFRRNVSRRDSSPRRLYIVAPASSRPWYGRQDGGATAGAARVCYALANTVAPLYERRNS